MNQYIIQSESWRMSSVRLERLAARPAAGTVRRLRPAARTPAVEPAPHGLPLRAAGGTVRGRGPSDDHPPHHPLPAEVDLGVPVVTVEPAELASGGMCGPVREPRAGVPQVVRPDRRGPRPTGIRRRRGATRPTGRSAARRDDVAGLGGRGHGFFSLKPQAAKPRKRKRPRRVTGDE